MVDYTVYYPGQYGITPSGDQTSHFTTLEGTIAGAQFDLQGGSYPVTAWKTGNRYVNGALQFKGVDVPVESTYRYRAFRLTDTALNAHWAQDKAHVGPRGRICVPYVEGSNHHASDNTLMMKESVDGGATWSAPEVIVRPETGLQTSIAGNNDRITCMSAGVSEGGRQVFFLLKREATTQTFHLWHRKMPDHRKILTGCLADTFSANAKLRIEYDGHGYVTGDVVTFPSLVVNGIDLVAGGVLNGLTLPSSTVTVTNASDHFFEFAMNGTPTASQSNIPTTCTLQNGWGDFTKTDITSTLVTLYQTKVPGAVANDLNYMHSFALADNGDILTSMSTSQSAYILRFASVYAIAPTIIDLGFKNGEITIVNAGSGRICGFSRGTDVSNPTDNASSFWRTSDNFVTVIRQDVRPWASSLGGQIWDEITPLTVCNGRILAARCERTDDPLDSQPAQRASMKIYLLEADVAAVFSSGISAFKFTEIGRAYWTGARTSQSGPNVGVGSWVTITPPVDAINNALTGVTPQYERAMYFFGSEMETISGENGEFSRGQIYGIEVIDKRAPDHVLQEGGRADGGTAERLDVIRWRGNESPSKFNSGWAVSTGTYQTANPPTSPVDLTNSVDYKGGGVTLSKDRTGRVTMWGRLDATSSSPSRVAFSLPRGYVPSHDVQFLVPAGALKQSNRGDGITLAVTIFGSNCDLAADRGTVNIDRVGAQGLVAVTRNVSLDGLSWLADGDAR